jgi:hypothetical protein
MADVGTSFIPTELKGEHYRAIGGVYDSLERAMQAMEQHFRNRHGGGGVLQVYRPEVAGGVAAVVEVAATNQDPMTVRAVYKILVQPSGG